MAGAFAFAVLPLAFLLVIAFYVGLFYVACLLTSSPLPPFFRSVGLVALAFFTSLLIGLTIVVGFAVILVLCYDVNPEAVHSMGGSGVGAIFIRIIMSLFSFCLFVVIAGMIYNWGLNIDNGQGIATVQYGIPMALSMLIFTVGIIGRMTGVIVDPPAPEPAPVARVAPAPPRPAPRIHREVVVEPTPEPEPPTPAFEIPQAPAEPDPALADPALASNPYRPPGTVSHQPFNRSVQPQPAMPADTNLFPNAGNGPNRFGAQQPGEAAAESLPFDISPGPGAEPLPATRPRPESLLGRADWAMEYGQLNTALQHLYAAAVVEDAELVWQNVAWGESFNRPMFCVMWGVGVDGAIPSGVDADTATAGILPAVRGELQDLARRTVFGKHAEQLVQDIGMEVDRRKLLANAREAGIDVLATVSLQNKPGAPGRGNELTLYVYLFDVATGRSLWRSDGLTRTRYLLALNQGQDLGIDLAAEAGQQASRLCRLIPNCPLEVADARTAIRSYIDSRPSNPLEGLYRLNYLHRQKKITDTEKSLFLNDLVGKEAADVLAGADPAAKQQWVARWLPELRTPTLRRPAANGNRPFSGFSGGRPGLPADDPAAEEPPIEPDESGFPRRPVTPGTGGNRFFID